MPRRRPQGWWCSRGLFDDFIDGLDYDEFLRLMDIYDVSYSEDCECEFDDEFIEHLDNQRW